MGSRRILEFPLWSARGRVDVIGRLVDIALAVVAIAAVVELVGGGTFSGALARAAIALVVVGAAWSLRRRNAVAGGITSLAIGLTAVAVGEAMGYGRRPGVAISAGSLAGTTLFVAGAVLVLLAAIGLVAGVRGWPRRLLAALVVGAVLVAGRILFVDPVAEAVRMTNVVRTEVADATPADLGLEYEDVVFPAADGTRLSGWYVPSSNGAAIVVAHGSSSSRSSVLDYAGVLARHGYGVLLFDARGQGHSEGRAMDLGWEGDADLEGAVTFVAGLPDVDAQRIAVVGISLGGEAAIGAAATDTRIQAVVADGATYRRLGDWTPHSDDGALGRVIDWVMFTTADLLTASHPPIRLRDAVTESSPRPVLLIASGAGNELDAARELQEISTENVDVWEVPDAVHVGELAAHPAEWEARVTDFLQRALGGTMP